MGIKVPEISTKSINRKNVECTRKIPQLMIRGEDIVLIGEDKSEGDAGSWDKITRKMLEIKFRFLKLKVNLTLVLI